MRSSFNVGIGLLLFWHWVHCLFPLHLQLLLRKSAFSSNFRLLILFVSVSPFRFYFCWPWWFSMCATGLGMKRNSSSICLRKALSHTMHVCALCIILSYYICSCLYSFTFDFFSSLLFSFQEWLGFFDFLSSVSMCCVHYMKMETITPYHFMH